MKIAIVFSVCVLVGCSVGGEKTDQNATIEALIAATSIARSAESSTYTSVASTSTANAGVLFADPDFGIYFFIPADYEIDRTHDGDSAPESREYYITAGQYSITVVLLDEGLPASPTSTTTPEPHLRGFDCDSLKPGLPESYESNDAYEEARLDWVICVDAQAAREQAADEQGQIDATNMAMDEASSAYQTEEAERDAPPPPTVITERPFIVSGYPGTIALLHHGFYDSRSNQWVENDSVRLSIRFPDGFSVRIFVSGGTKPEEFLERIAWTVQVKRLTLPS